MPVADKTRQFGLAIAQRFAIHFCTSVTALEFGIRVQDCKGGPGVGHGP
jgi:hypothetical protein